MKYPIWALMALSLASGKALAQKTDVLIFKNGDRLTGEVRRLDRGMLSFNTDAIGTIRVDWDEIAYLSSDQRIEVELQSGIRYLGELTHADEPEQIQVVVNGEEIAVQLARVVLMTPIEETFIEQLDLDIALGYNFTKSSDVAVSNADIDVVYRRERVGGSFSFDTFLTDKNITVIDSSGMEQTVKESTQRQILNGTYDRFFDNRWLAKGLLGFERNDELGVELRTTVGGAGGRYLRQTNTHRIQLLGGLAYSQEKITDSDQTENTIEGVGIATFEWFRFNTPELDISTNLVVLPNLSDPGRFRSNIDIDFRWEIIEDLFWGLSIYHTYDSDPPNPNASQRDYGIITSLGWSL